MVRASARAFFLRNTRTAMTATVLILQNAITVSDAVVAP